MKALVTFGLGKLTIGYAHRIYEGLQQYQWQVHEPLCHGRPVLPAPETPASDAICTDMTGYTGGVTTLPEDCHRCQHSFDRPKAYRYLCVKPNSSIQLAC